MKAFLGFIVIVFGALLGLYLGGWVCFIGGIIQVIEAAKADPVNALVIATGLLRFLVSALVGWFSFFLVGGFGVYLITSR